MDDDGSKKLNEAYRELEREMPERVSSAIRWLRDPDSRWIIGVALIGVGLVGPALPVVGLEMIPLGLLLIAQDVPFLRKPVGDATIWLEKNPASMVAGHAATITHVAGHAVTADYFCVAKSGLEPYAPHQKSNSSPRKPLRFFL